MFESSLHHGRAWFLHKKWGPFPSPAANPPCATGPESGAGWPLGPSNKPEHIPGLRGREGPGRLFTGQSPKETSCIPGAETQWQRVGSWGDGGNAARRAWRASERLGKLLFVPQRKVGAVTGLLLQSWRVG